MTTSRFGAIGIVNNEIDRGGLVPAPALSIFGLVGVAAKGALNTRTDISSIAELTEVFGKSVSNAGRVAQAYLRRGRALVFVRVGSAGYTAVAKASGDDSTVTFSFVLTGFPIRSGTVSITDGTETFTDPTGSGTLTGDDGGTGTIVYSSGAVSVTFNTAPASAVGNITATYQTTDSLKKATVTLDDSVPVDSLIVTAITDGTWGNTLSIKIETGTAASSFRLSVVDGLTAVETFDNLTLSNVLATINGISTYITVAIASGSPTIPANGTFAMAGGANGANDLSDTDVTGGVDSTKGLQLLRDPDILEVDFMAAPDKISATIIEEMIAICEERGECMCLVDPPDSLTYAQVIDFRNGTGYDHSAFASDFAAMYWPWLYVKDIHTGETVSLPPSGVAASVLAFTEESEHYSRAPAGFKRGKYPYSRGLKAVSPSRLERSRLEAAEVNPIVDFPREGVAVFGENLLNTDDTLLINKVAIRRTLNKAKRELTASLNGITFEPNDEMTWRDVTHIASKILEEIKNQRGILAYEVVCDSSVNPPANIDLGKLTVKIVIQPTRAVEVIVLNWYITRTGSEFTEIV